MPVALISTITSPAFGPSSFTVASSSGFPAAKATAALTSMRNSFCLVAVGFLGDVSAPCPQRPEHEQKYQHEQEHTAECRTDCGHRAHRGECACTRERLRVRGMGFWLHEGRGSRPGLDLFPGNT